MAWRFIFSAILISSMVSASAQNKQDIESIKSLCGCFEVTFKYAETFATDKDYKLKDKYTASGLEWAGLVEGSDKKFVIQHILVVDDSMIVKHWREDWTYQNTDVLQFNHDMQWKKLRLQPGEVAGQWTQSVWEVDDAPRYQGSAYWIHQNGQHFWKNATDAPLPRREYTKRNDYNVLNRGNTIQLTPNGWTHEQDNSKIIRKDGQPDQVLVLEKGYNIYKKVDDKKCFAAKDWWTKNVTYWNKVRTNWDELIAKKDIVTLRREVKSQTLTSRLEDLENNAVANKEDVTPKIKKILAEHTD